MNINTIMNALSWTNLKMPLFYNSDYGLRFNTATMGLEITDPKYFDTAVNRATILFKDVFDASHLLTLIINTSCYTDEIDTENWSLSPEILECIETSNAEIISQTLPYIHDPEDADMITIRTFIKLELSNLNYIELIKRICRADLGRKPSIKDEVFILNDDLSIAYIFYDDRGVDIAAKTGSLVSALYRLRKDWLYDYEREHVTKL